MIKDNDLIVVRNRNNGSTGYELPERHIHRVWRVNETKRIPFEELKEFSYTPAGPYMLNNLFVIENQEALDLLNMEVEPEYYYTEEDIRKLLFMGTIDEFEDFINFAPIGALGIAKDIAVKEEIPDVRKRDMLSKKTGLNINNAIMVNHALAEDDKPKAAEEPVKERKAAKPEIDAIEDKPVRKAATPQYKVVSK